MQELQNGSLLQNGKYRIVKVLGQGGFGITYEGIQTGLNRRVAIKEFFMKDYCDRDKNNNHVTDIGTVGTLSMVAQFREKFVKEAQLIASMDNAPHVVRIHDIFQENSTAYYVMEFIESGSLEQLVKKEGALNERRALLLTRQAAEALSALHQKQTMHLDVKPANILHRKDMNGNDDVVLIDFGVSKHYDGQGRQTTTTPVGFSKGYAPIEQYREGGVGQFSPASDVYSLGATLYYLLTATIPPESSDLLEEPIERPQGISDATWKIISHAMESMRKNRYQSMSEMIADIKTAITPSPNMQRQAPAPEPKKPEPPKPKPPKPQSTPTAPASTATRISQQPSKATEIANPAVKKKSGHTKKVGIFLGCILLLTGLVGGIIVFNDDSLQLSSVEMEIDYVKYDLNGLSHTAIFKSSTFQRIGTYDIPSTITYQGETYTVTEIGSHALEYSEVNTVRIPDCVKTISSSAFYRCEELSEVVFGEGIEEIQSSAFSKCEKLHHIVIPSTTKTIGYAAFEDCNLNTVVCLATEPPRTDSGAFTEAIRSNATLYVPQSSINAYINASPWGNFGSIRPYQ